MWLTLQMSEICFKLVNLLLYFLLLYSLYHDRQTYYNLVAPHKDPVALQMTNIGQVLASVCVRERERKGMQTKQPVFSLSPKCSQQEVTPSSCPHQKGNICSLF